MPFNATRKRPARPKLKRKTPRPPMTPQEARQAAYEMVQAQRLSPLCYQVLDALAVGGVLTRSQLERLTFISERSQIRYYKQHLLDRLSPQILHLDRLGLKCQRLYKLGAVGMELAEERHRMVVRGYEGLGMGRVTHDVLCNEVMTQLVKRAAHLKVSATWRSKYEATVHDSHGRPSLEPDGMMVFDFPSGKRQMVVVEYHNEDYAGRVRKKIDGYEDAYRQGYWRQAWGTDQMPVVLVIWTHRTVGRAYQEALERMSYGLRCTYLGRSWESFAEKKPAELWLRLDGSKEVVSILDATWQEGA